MLLTKAKICGVNKNGAPDFSSAFYVPFNPNEISISEACASYYEKIEDETKKENQHKGKKTNLSTTLFFNTLTSLSEKDCKDVRLEIRRFYEFTNMDNKEEQKLKKIVFTWGSICLIGILESMEVKYTMFSSSGMPVRATVSITISGDYYGEQRASTEQNPKSVTLQTKETSFLDAMAAYEDPCKWKIYAKKEGRKDPFS